MKKRRDPFELLRQLLSGDGEDAKVFDPHAPENGFEFRKADYDGGGFDTPRMKDEVVELQPGEHLFAKEWIRLFVYGLLMKKTGSALNKLLQECGGVYLGEAVLPGWSLYGKPVCVALPSEGKRIKGEVHLVPKANIGHIDMVERGYKRLAAVLEDGSVVQFYGQMGFAHPSTIEIGEDYMPTYREMVS